jgi:enoyl-CoA hydratase
VVAPVAVAASMELLSNTRDHSVAESFTYMNALQPGVFDPEDIARAVAAQKAGQPAVFADLPPIQPAMG